MHMMRWILIGAVVAPILVINVIALKRAAFFNAAISEIERDFKSAEASEVVLVLSLPRQPDLQADDGSSLDLGQFRGGLNDGKYVGCINACDSYRTLSDKRLDQLARGGGYANLKEFDTKQRRDAAAKRQAERAERLSIDGTRESEFQKRVDEGDARRREEYQEWERRRGNMPFFDGSLEGTLGPVFMLVMMGGLAAIIVSSIRQFFGQFSPAAADAAAPTLEPVAAPHAAPTSRPQPRVGFGKR